MDSNNIQDQLNIEFAQSDTRIVFWFDDKGECEDEVCAKRQIFMILCRKRVEIKRN